MAWEENETQTQLRRVLAILKLVIIAPQSGPCLCLKFRAPVKSTQHSLNYPSAQKSWFWGFAIPDSSSVAWGALVITASLGLAGWHFLCSPPLDCKSGATLHPR